MAKKPTKITISGPDGKMEFEVQETSPASELERIRRIIDSHLGMRFEAMAARNATDLAEKLKLTPAPPVSA